MKSAGRRRLAGAHLHYRQEIYISLWRITASACDEIRSRQTDRRVPGVLPPASSALADRKTIGGSAVAAAGAPRSVSGTGRDRPADRCPSVGQSVM